MIFGFKQRFWAKVQSGEKRHTVRRRRANARVGMTMHLDGRVRQRDQFRLVVPEPECSAIDTIIVHEDAIHIRPGRLTTDGFEQLRDFIQARWYGPAPAGLNGHTEEGGAFSRLASDEMESFAVADGFANWAEMRQFWYDEHFPFVGEVYYW